MGMKTNYISLIVFSILLIAASCADQKPADDVLADNPKAVVGRWKLTKEERTGKNHEKGVQFANQPTNVILHIENNGYFTIYDTFIDPAWKKKGLPMILRRSKGQWELSGQTLALTHLSEDTSYTEKVEITSINDEELVTKGQDKKSNVYKTYGK
jgi:hypothetical protein